MKFRDSERHFMRADRLGRYGPDHRCTYRQTVEIVHAFALQRCSLPPAMRLLTRKTSAFSDMLMVGILVAFCAAIASFFLSIGLSGSIFHVRLLMAGMAHRR